VCPHTQLCDVQPGVLGGINSEFVFVGRLDNLCMSYLALQSLADACAGDNALAEETGVRAIALFDHEEVGSDSAQGAGSPVMRDTITRVARVLSGGEADAPERSLRNSFLVSADMAHALHPNYQVWSALVWNRGRGHAPELASSPEKMAKGL